MQPKRPEIVLTNRLPDVGVEFDVQAFENLINAQGVPMTHYRAMGCPVGLKDRNDVRRSHDDHSGCSNGFLYTKAGELMSLFTGNSSSSMMTEAGLMEVATVNATMQRFYHGTQEVPDFLPYDRVYFTDEAITVGHWEKVECTGTGTDKLRFPVVQVVDIVDSEGFRYSPDDYEIVEGKLRWVGNRPGLDPETGRGQVYTVRYRYRPYWYIKQLVHEVRLANASNVYTGVRAVQRLPQAMVLQREHVFENEENDDQALDPNSPRQVRGPPGSPSLR